MLLPSGQKVKVTQAGNVSLGFFPKGEHALKIESAQALETTSILLQVDNRAVAIREQTHITHFDQKGRVTDLQGQGLQGVQVTVAGESVLSDQKGEFLLKGLKEGAALVQLSKSKFLFGEAKEREVSGLKASWEDMQAIGVVNTVNVDTYQESYESIELVVRRDGKEVQNIQTAQESYSLEMMAGSTYSVSVLLKAQG